MGPEQLAREKSTMVQQLLSLEVTVVNLLPVLDGLVGVLDELDERTFLAYHALQVVLGLEDPLPVLPKPDGFFHHGEPLLCRDRAQFLNHPLMHYNQEVVWVNPEFPQ